MSDYVTTKQPWPQSPALRMEWMELREREVQVHEELAEIKRRLWELEKEEMMMKSL